MFCYYINNKMNQYNEEDFQYIVEKTKNKVNYFFKNNNIIHISHKKWEWIHI